VDGNGDEDGDDGDVDIGGGSTRGTRLLAGRGLAFFQAEGDEAVRRVIGRETNGHTIARDHSNPEASHSPGELCSHRLPALERNLIAATAENFVDATGRLYQVISRQIESILPAFDRVRTGVSPADRALSSSSGPLEFRVIYATPNEADPFEERAG
jgi:hypothetical protein